MIKFERKAFGIGIAVIVITAIFGVVWMTVARQSEDVDDAGSDFVLTVPEKPTFDRFAYDCKMRRLAHLEDCLPRIEEVFEPGLIMGGAINAVGFGVEGDQEAVEVQDDLSDQERLWPAKAAYPNEGAILPFKRIVAYYGNFYSTGMGVLGEYPEEVMLNMFRKEIDAWEAADPETPVMPAIDYIAVTAQLSPGKDGGYRARMPDSQIERARELAAKINGIVILEVQSGLADLMTEIRALEPHLIMPEVHLAIDPEFAMVRSGARPGTVVGTVDAVEVNVAIDYLSDLVKQHNLPPKVLVVHRYTRPMVTNAVEITPTPEVQVVMDMDGWGPPAQKYASYDSYIYPYPVQFTGFKLFYKNDVKIPGTRLLTPAELLKLTPQPSFIQYQ